jgi:hypothetical protein
VYREQAPPPHPLAPPQRIATFLRVVRILLGYGRHLADTVNHRAAAPGFATIAACFGTANLALILARLHRGILRAAALERVLLARAARGRDIRLAASRNRAANRPPVPADAAGQQTAPPTPRHVAPAPSLSLGPDHPANFHTPTLEQLEAQVRRRPLGRTIVDICLDLAVVPGLCTGTFWNELFDLARCHGGSIARLMQERCRREQAFSHEQDTYPTPARNWSNPGRQTIRQVLGFFIGEHPVAPFALSAPTAAATGPP